MINEERLRELFASHGIAIKPATHGIGTVTFTVNGEKKTITTKEFFDLDRYEDAEEALPH